MWWLWQFGWCFFPKWFTCQADPQDKAKCFKVVHSQKLDHNCTESLLYRGGLVGLLGVVGVVQNPPTVYIPSRVSRCTTLQNLNPISRSMLKLSNGKNWTKTVQNCALMGLVWWGGGVGWGTSN